MYTSLAEYNTTLNHLVESHVGTQAMKADLVDKIVYDDPAVFRRLRIDQVNKDFVAACAASFNAANAQDIRLLIKLVEITELEIEEINDATNILNKEERSGNLASEEEKKMYDPLECVVAIVSSIILTLINYRCAYLTS